MHESRRNTRAKVVGRGTCCADVKPKSENRVTSVARSASANELRELRTQTADSKESRIRALRGFAFWRRCGPWLLGHGREEDDAAEESEQRECGHPYTTQVRVRLE